MVQHIYLCPSGHSICSGCFTIVCNRTGNCPTCKAKYAKQAPRNFAMENLVAQCYLPFKFNCGIRMKGAELLEHHVSCTMKPILCPIKDCTHRGSASTMLSHIVNAHVDTDRSKVKRVTELKIQLTTRNGSCSFAGLLGTGSTSLLLSDMQVLDGSFTGKALHFDQPMVVTLLVQQDENDQVRIKTRSRHVTAVGDGSNIKLPVCMFEHYIPPEKGVVMAEITAEPLLE
eukprot:TRINITY_DN73093_c0_g1_i1.p1 TRINITY_DN73093_c0_g1~~TRINITY_DN73093_c0_g1_i1.p1  ORF type:complete len:262 (+),score=21.80 TRINITY_DN73093_c0_g1_i1:101-787(+)